MKLLPYLGTEKNTSVVKSLHYRITFSYMLVTGEWHKAFISKTIGHLGGASTFKKFGDLGLNLQQEANAKISGMRLENKMMSICWAEGRLHVL